MNKEKLIEALRLCLNDNTTIGEMREKFNIKVEHEDDSNDLYTMTQHLIADQLLLLYINDPEITEAYEEVPKWYA